MATRRRVSMVVMATLLLPVVAACGSRGESDVVSAPTTGDAPNASTDEWTTVGTETTSIPAPTTVGPSTTSASTTTIALETTTTAPPSTSDAPPPTDAPATSIVGRDVPYWSVDCVERLGSEDATPEFAPELAAFSTLGARPSLDLLAPVVQMSSDRGESIASTHPVPGGVLVGVYPPTGWPTPDTVSSSSLVAVDESGSVRWRRCFDDLETRGFLVAPPALGPTWAWVVASVWRQPLEMRVVDLVTGADVPLPIDASGRGLIGSGERFMVLGERRTEAPIASTATLTVVDLLNGTIQEIPYPPAAFGERADSVWFMVHDVDPLDDEAVLVYESAPPGSMRSVFVDGSWRDDATTLRTVLPPTVSATFGEPFELQLRDGSGDLVWAAQDFHGLGREGFHWTVADNVVLAMRCSEWDAAGFCGWTDEGPPAEELVAFDIVTGQQLWTLPGPHAVPVLDGDRAIITIEGENDGYTLVDLLVGEPVDTDSPDTGVWPVGSFAEECCGGEEFVHVEQHGGVVIATNERHVRVWYPPALTVPTIAVDLMG